jgi:asparagine synthase (glutamine-hydrolysing)
MCGIAGIIQLATGSDSQRDAITRRLHSMQECLRHRGPDGHATWVNPAGSAGLAHRRLSIIDLSEAASQPMHFLNRYTIVHNGEIYNYPELRNELIALGYSFSTHSDTEVILKAYDHWKEECLEHFDGMFAFAIWDEQEQELLAARDRFGEKPLYYYQQDGTLFFASEMKALWSAGVPRNLNLKMVFNFLTIGYVDNPERPEETFYEQVFRLPAASRLYYSPGSSEPEIERYWDIDMDHQDRTISDAEAINKFTALFNQSVQRRLRSDVSIGTSLSGGLDSSSIVSMINRNPGQRYGYKTFTAVFEGYEKNEARYAERVASEFSLEQYKVRVDVEDMINDWNVFMHHQEEPVASASAYAQYKVFELAGEAGVTVLLDGQGADEILAGYSKYYKWYWQELFRHRTLNRSGEVAAARKLGVKENFGMRNVMASLLPDLASVILERQYLFNALNHPRLTKDFVRYQSKEAYYTTPELSSLNGVLYFNTMVHGLEELLRYADRNAMAHGREVRLPFLNHDLVEFIFSLPAHFKIRNGWTKWILRQSMNDHLPSEITWRKDKVGFEPPQKQWMENKKLRDMIQDARQKLIREKILLPSVSNAPIQPTAAYEADTDDWKYLSLAFFM